MATKKTLQKLVNNNVITIDQLGRTVLTDEAWERMITPTAHLPVEPRKYERIKKEPD
jgi:hypothetical protein